MSAPPGVPLKRRPSPRVKSDWMDDAACRANKSGFDFVSDNAGELLDAQQFCLSRCPVRDACLAFAESRRVGVTGVWGGELFGESAERVAVRPYGVAQ